MSLTLEITLTAIGQVARAERVGVTLGVAEAAALQEHLAGLTAHPPRRPPPPQEPRDSTLRAIAALEVSLAHARTAIIDEVEARGLEVDHLRTELRRVLAERDQLRAALHHERRRG